MKKNLLTYLLLLIATTTTVAQYSGVPWKGTPWVFGKDNDANFANTIIGWKYDIGEAIAANPVTATSPLTDLVSVLGKNEGDLRTNTAAPTVNARIAGATAESKTLLQSDINLTKANSNFQWHATDQRWRDGAQWARYTVTFEEGSYVFLNRGLPNSGGNFNFTLTIFNTKMEVVYGPIERNNLAQLGTFTTDLGSNPEGEYAKLPPAPNTATKWYKWDDSFALNGTYIVQVHSLRSGALGGAIGEFTFMESLPAGPKIASVDFAQINGCNASTTITVNATPFLAGNDLQYQFKYKNSIVGSEWTTNKTLITAGAGNWEVSVKETGSVFIASQKFVIEKINCQNSPYAIQAAAIPGAIEFESFDFGGEGIAYNELNSPLANSGNWDVRNSQENGQMGMDISEVAGKVAITSMGDFGSTPETAEWMLYSVNVAETGDYTLTLHYNPNAVNSSKFLNFEFISAGKTYDKFRFSVPGSTEADWLEKVLDYPMNLAAGSYQLKVYANAGGMLLDKMELVKKTLTSPTIQVLNNPVIQAFQIKVKSNKNAKAYLVPAGTIPTDDLAALSIGSVDLIAQVEGKIDTPKGIKPGNYLVCAVDKTGNVSASSPVEIIEMPTNWVYDYEEVNGLVVIETESLTLDTQWSVSTDKTGYTGSGYISWKGAQSFSSVANGNIKIKVLIRNPGVYRFDWRAMVGYGTLNTEHNDSWLKIQADDFYGYRANGNTNVHPRPLCNTLGYTCPAGSSVEGFFKLFGGTLQGWAWKAVTSDFNDHNIFARFDSPGVYTITIAARSSHHAIDRIIMYNTSMVTENNAQLLSNNETKLAPTSIGDAPNYRTTKLLVSPNPANDYLYIHEQSNINNCIYQVVGIAGIVIKTGLVNNNNNSIPVGDLPRGTYILVVTDNEGQSLNSTFIKK